ncbi:MAG: hypothetical protein BWX86_03012 [Verrucomicrobia bacterium ADurb.Bin122]|nr:MAG: hypothetical protein BWX86_03012 [Verrucomicrobia bacterium ADurb.Bin122]
MVQQMRRKLSPADLAQKRLFSGTRGKHAALRRTRPQRRPDLARRELAKMQMRRQPRGARLCRKIASRRVVVHRPVEEALQPALRTGLPRLPFGGKSVGPLTRGQQRQSVECE